MLSIYVLAFFLLFSCQKARQNVTSPYYIHLTIDSVSRDFSSDAKADMVTIGPIFNFGITGHPTPDPNAENLRLLIWNSPSNRPLVTGTYGQPDTNFILDGMYNPGSSYIYSAGDDLSPPIPLSITIDSIDSSTVKGSFRGEFYGHYAGSSILGPEKKTLTGQFYLKLVFAP